MDTIGGANWSDGIPALVNRLTIVVLTMMLLEANVGIREFNWDATVASDDVNPLNRVIWLSLLGACGIHRTCLLAIRAETVCTPHILIASISVLLARLFRRLEPS